MNKAVKPNITIPENFARNGVKTDFSNSKLENGFDSIKPDVLSGDNLNKFIDDTYQGLNYSISTSDAINSLDEHEFLSVHDSEFENLPLAVSNAILTNETSNNSFIYDYVSKYRHSTFDLSKFEVVGSPTITDDGVVSGFSASNYLKILDNFNPQGKWEIILRVKEPSTPPLSGDSYYLGNLDITNNRNIVIGMDTNGRFKLWLSSDGTSWDIVSGITIPGTINDYVFLKVGFDETKYYIEKSLDGETWTDRREQSFSTKIYPSSLLLGIAFGSAFYTKGSIDLKHFLITVDGKEVFSGNKTGVDTVKINDDYVEIPYTESKTGSKIVDVAYRDRVIDLYEQQGQAGYYTIDEENKNFTLPMGEIYGMIEDKATKNYIEVVKNNIESELSKKADLNANNLSTDGKSLISGLGMPSDKYINLTLGASGSIYTAPANGWYSIEKGAGVSSSYLQLKNISCSLKTEYSSKNSTDFGKLFLPARKGQQVIAEYNMTGTTNYFIFIYAEGEV